MEEIDLLPPELRTRSIDECEIVLTYEDALQAIDHLATRGWAMLAWEGWILYPDGTIGASSRHQGTISIRRAPGQPWEEHIRSAAKFCRRTMLADYRGEQRRPEVAGGTLYFCLSAIPESQG